MLCLERHSFECGSIFFSVSELFIVNIFNVYRVVLGTIFIYGVCSVELESGFCVHAVVLLQD